MSEQADFETLLDYLARTRAFDFTGYKRASLMRRVTKRMHEVGVEGYAEYLDYLEVNPDEFESLFNTILINVTTFFRDREPWDALAEEVVPRLLEHDESRPLRVWSAGCAAGQEPYSVAMLFAETLGPEEFASRVKIFATDVDEEALTQARQGSYSAKETEELPAELRERYFEQDGERFVFRKDLRRAVIFGRNDLVQDAPISRVDLLLCRNTLMYFHAETQARVLDRFHFALNARGALFLGRSEMLTRHPELFRPLDGGNRLFEKVPVTRPRARPEVVGAGLAGDGVAEVDERMRQAAADIAPVAQVVIDTDDRVIVANREARGLFGLAETDFGRPFQDLKLSYRPAELRSAIDQIRKEPKAIDLGEVAWTMAGGERRQLDVRLVPLLAEGGLLGISIVFDDVTRFQRLEDELANTKSDAETAYEELQSTSEELETTNEELQSTNEELETINEELQSTNEELETTNEELQSTNEELGTVNEQLRERTTEVDSANIFLDGILASLPYGVIVVNRNLEVELWNRQSEDLWGLRADEVRGRHLLNLDMGLPVDGLKAPIRASMEGESTSKPVTLQAVNRRGRSIEARVSCQSLSGSDGLRGVIVLVDARSNRKD